MFKIVSCKITFCKIIFFLLTGFSLLLYGCAGSAQNKNSSDEARSAAYDALNRMNGGEPADSQQAGAGAASQPGSQPGAQPSSGSPAGADSRAKPAWVDSPDAVYSRQKYVSAVGFGADRRQAERTALANLTGVFGQSIQAELKTVSTYSEAVMSGVIQVTENSSVQDAITTSMEMDTLIGAQIADVWFDGKTIYYAAAVMEKEKSAVLYADLIHSNERIISSLVSMTPEEKNTLNGYSRYLLAAAIADANRVYANVLTLVGNSSGINPGTMKKGDDYRIEATDIARNIPIAVVVEGDRSNRIRNAFSRSLSAAGFRSGGNDSRYVLDANLTMTDANLPNQQNVFVRYIVDVSLVDTTDNSVLFPFSFNGREGHINKAEAEERALKAAENRIGSEYAQNFRDYLSLLLPR
ncbi:MAG: LPP20 family lipoprotein [Treponema sp.]|nr:LPP20 family lipoprotein [Treponema sp.]